MGTLNDVAGNPMADGEEQALLATWLAGAGQGVALFDAQWTLRYANEAWRAITGTAANRPVHLYELLPQLQPTLAALIAHFDEGRVHPPATLPVPGTGRSRHWEVALLRAGDGGLILLSDRSDQALARQALERRVADHTRKLSTLYDVITATAEAPDLRGTLQWSLERVLSAIQCPAGAIQLIDDFDENVAARALRLVARQGLADDVAGALANAAIDGGLAQIVMESQEPLIVGALRRHVSAADPLRRCALQTYVGAAMRVRERTVGVLSVFAHEGQRFGRMELALLDSVADQIAVVVENAFLHKRSEESAVVEERHRLARELHDSVTQAIYSLTLFTEAGLRLVRSGDQALVAECLQRLDETSRLALREMRLMLHELRPPDLEEEGLSGALQQRLNEVETRANVKARLIVSGDVDELPEAVEEQLYRIAQEALNNALKHANASLLTIEISADDEDVALEIRDNGRGFDVDDALESGGLGLRGLEERVGTLDGELSITSAPGAGTTILVSVDLEELDLAEDDALF